MSWFGRLVILLFGLCQLFPVLAQTRYVAPGGSDAGPNPCTNILTPCATIQHAHNQAASGDTIQIAAGTYSESPRVTKSVSLQGAGQTSTIIAPQLSAQLPDPIIGTGAVILAVDGPVTVSIRDLQVRFPSAQYPPTSTAPVEGILTIRNPTVLIERVLVQEIHDATVSGTQAGNCIRAGRFVSPISYPGGTITLRDSELRFCQKTGIVCNEAGTICTIENSLIRDGGLGEQNPPNPPRTQTVIAPNGIQFGFGARGTIRNNTIRRFQCELASPTCGPSIDSDSFFGCGILLYLSAAPTQVLGNLIETSDGGLCSYPDVGGSPVDVRNNTFQTNRWRNALVFPGITEFRGNTLIGANEGLLVYGAQNCAHAQALLNPATLPADANTIQSASVVGIWLRTFTGSLGGTCAPPGPIAGEAQVSGSANRFVGNVVGLDNQPDEGLAQLPCNWWGSAQGPGLGGANPALTSPGDVVSPHAINDTDFACPATGPLITINASKTGPATVTPGVPFTWTLTVTNAGPADGSGTTISDPVPTGITSFSWTCAASGGAVCPAASGIGAIAHTVSVFPPGGSLTYTITAVLGSGSAFVRNEATIDPRPAVPGSTVVVVSAVAGIPPRAVPFLGLLSLLALSLGLSAIAFFLLRR